MTEDAEPYIFLVSKFYSHLLIPGSDVRVRWVPEKGLITGEGAVRLRPGEQEYGFNGIL